MSENIREKLIDFLRKKNRACTFEIVEMTNFNWIEVLDNLFKLEKEGRVRRIKVLDPTKPLATAIWEICECEVAEETKAGELGIVTAIILNPPLLRDLYNCPPGSMGLLDSLSYLVCHASQSLRIAMPYVGDLISTLFTQHLQELRRLSILRIITENTRENKCVLEPLKLYLDNLEFCYASIYSQGIKTLGAHLKLLIADENMAILGTFNLTRAHLLVNYDIGLLIRGDVVKHLCKIYDELWEKLRAATHEGT
ncbi:MAG: phospholipase D-like domain-containing protein [Candidatus Bathyarchaeia archaeon]